MEAFNVSFKMSFSSKRCRSSEQLAQGWNLKISFAIWSTVASSASFLALLLPFGPHQLRDFVSSDSFFSLSSVFSTAVKSVSKSAFTSILLVRSTSIVTYFLIKDLDFLDGRGREPVLILRAAYQLVSVTRNSHTSFVKKLFKGLRLLILVVLIWTYLQPSNQHHY